MPTVLKTVGSDICPLGKRYTPSECDMCLRYAICSLRERGQISYRIERSEIYRNGKAVISCFAYMQNISPLEFAVQFPCLQRYETKIPTEFFIQPVFYLSLGTPCIQPRFFLLPYGSKVSSGSITVSIGVSCTSVSAPSSSAIIVMMSKTRIREKSNVIA